MTTRKRTTALSDMVYDEVSLVGVPANQEADIVLFKGSRKKRRKGGKEEMDEENYEKTKDGMEKSTVSHRSHAGLIALARHRIAKMSPTASDVHVETALKPHKKKKRIKVAVVDKPEDD